MTRKQARGFQSGTKAIAMLGYTGPDMSADLRTRFRKLKSRRCAPPGKLNVQTQTCWDARVHVCACVIIRAHVRVWAPVATRARVSKCQRPRVAMQRVGGGAFRRGSAS